MLRVLGLLAAAIVVTAATAALAATPDPAVSGGNAQARADWRFASIDGGEIGFADWPGRPVLVVNTASLCGFTPQFDELQALYERYSGAGLVVLAVPSNDFRQELRDDAAVRDFCEMTFGLTLPMTTITTVSGPGAHPLFAWLAAEHGFVPRWNFNKALIGADGTVLGTWGSREGPMGRAITSAVEDALGL
ncbi:MAG: glutathione peroxidase [Rubellimicrobium sp.]|nr:glutathione peroxidase [Rubellimicrobium sp.]